MEPAGPAFNPTACCPEPCRTFGANREDIRAARRHRPLPTAAAPGTCAGQKAAAPTPCLVHALMKTLTVCLAAESQ